MSLLLEALKKAEKAKEEAQGKHVTKRDELPDISAPLEILSDDLQPAAPGSRVAPGSVASRPVSDTGASDAAGAARAAAQKVFEAKFKEPDPRLPFHIATGVLAAFAIGTVAYFWIQLRPAPSMVNTNPARSASEKPVEAGAEKRAAVAAAPASAEAAAIPGLPGGSTSPVATIAAAAPAVRSAPTAPVAASGGGAARSRPAAKDEDRPLSVTRSGPLIHPQVSAGYTAYQAGDLAKARAEYQQVLRDEPANRDALLGLAAVEMRAQRHDLSDAYYQRVLRADPRDPHAQAGLLALHGRQLDPVLVESRVKSLLAAAGREADVLYFTLGNQYAQQGRWAEAQQAYFKAFATDPDNADFAFNLAVSLDQLRQPKLALEYYRRALDLAEKRTASFAPEVARTRVQQLSR